MTTTFLKDTVEFIMKKNNKKEPLISSGINSGGSDTALIRNRTLQNKTLPNYSDNITPIGAIIYLSTFKQVR